MVWTQSGSRVEWLSENWKIAYDLASPSGGVSVSSVRDKTAHWSVFQLHPQPHHSFQIEDSFLRSHDAVVRYAQSERDQFGFQVDLRQVPTAELGGFDFGLEVWLSVQTQLLDTHPKFLVDFGAPAGSWTAVAESALNRDASETTFPSGHFAAMDNSSASGHVALLVHPTDTAQTKLISSAAASTKLELLGSFMEKGVIRRVKLRLLIARSQQTSSSLAEAYTSFIGSPLPLTA